MEVLRCGALSLSPRPSPRRWCPFKAVSSKRLNSSKNQRWGPGKTRSWRPRAQARIPSLTKPAPGPCSALGSRGRTRPSLTPGRAHGAGAGRSRGRAGGAAGGRARARPPEPGPTPPPPSWTAGPGDHAPPPAGRPAAAAARPARGRRGPRGAGERAAEPGVGARAAGGRRAAGPLFLPAGRELGGPKPHSLAPR